MSAREKVAFGYHSLMQLRAIVAIRRISGAANDARRSAAVLAADRGHGIPSPVAAVRRDAAMPRRRKKMTETVTADKLMDDLHAVIRDAESLLKATAAETGEKIGEARARAEETVRQAKARLADVEDEALKRARALAAEADEYVRDNPWQVVGIAAGIGLVLGLLIGRR
jgi:ElaB/YqjD/DUF883 family membrane-anchored ribosome-binding protein